MHSVEVSSDGTILYRLLLLLCNSPINNVIAQFLSWQTGKNFPTATNTNITLELLLETMF